MHLLHFLLPKKFIENIGQRIYSGLQNPSNVLQDSTYQPVTKQEKVVKLQKYYTRYSFFLPFRWYLDHYVIPIFGFVILISLG
jgi:hypothetical protein